MSTFFDFGYFWFWVWLTIVLTVVLITWYKNKYYWRRGDYQSGYQRVRERKNVEDRLGWTAMFAVLGMVAAFFICFIGDLIAFNQVKEPTSWSRPIENLGDASGVEGHFYLGGGTVNSSPVYMYYLEEEDGFHLYNVYAYDARITYTDSTPQMVVHYNKSANTFWSRNLGYADDAEQYRSYEFQVPSGSVKQNYNLDAS